MQFLYPQFLWALTTLSIPVLIHLLNLRRAQKVYFSHLPLLQEALRATQRKVMLRRRFILLLRMLALGCLVLAFAHPYLPAQREGPPPAQVLLYLDNSLSMSNTTPEAESAWEIARDMARQIISLYPSTTTYYLLTTAQAPPRPQSATEAMENLSRLSTSPLYRDAVDILQRLSPYLETASTPMDIYWISDFQHSVFQRTQAVTDTVHQWFMLPIGDLNTHNLFVDTVYAKVPFFIEGHTQTLCTRIRSTSDISRPQLPVALVINGEQVALRTLSLPPQGKETLCFEWTPRAASFFRGQVRIEDTGLLFDNMRFFVLTPSAPLSVVEVKGKTASSYFALAYAQNDRFQMTSLPVDAIDYERLYEADLLIFNELETLSPSLVSAAIQQLENDKVLMVVPPAERMETATYEPVLSGLRAMRAVGASNSKSSKNSNSSKSSNNANNAVGAKSSNSSNSSKSSKNSNSSNSSNSSKSSRSARRPMEGLEVLDYGHPFFEGVFRSRERHASMPEARPLYRWEAVDAEALLRFSDGTSFLSVSARKGGLLYFFSSPMKASYTQFYAHPLFIPVLYKMAIHRHAQHAPLYYTINTPRIEVSEGDLSSQRFIMTQHEESLAPSSRFLGTRYHLFPSREDLRLGFYDLYADQRLLFPIAFNAIGKESEVAPLTSVAIRNYFAGVSKLSLFEVSQVEALRETFTRLHSTRPLWKTALWLALGFLLAEVLGLRYLWRNEYAYQKREGV